MDGDLVVDSELGQGSRFTILLPNRAPDEKQASILPTHADRKAA
jgi:hypothetical protein